MRDSPGPPAVPRRDRGMVLSRRMAALAAVVLIPLGTAATGFALADSPRDPRVPAEVARRAELSGRPVLAVAGTLGEGAQEVPGVGACHGILPAPMAPAQAPGRERLRQRRRTCPARNGRPRCGSSSGRRRSPAP
jgi:hypothetical protein